MQLSNMDWQLIKANPIFADFSPEEIITLLDVPEVQNFKKGEYLFRQGRAANTIYFLLEGRVKLLRLTVDGHETIITLLHPGHTIAACEAMRELDFLCDAKCLTATRVISIKPALLKERILECPEIALALVSKISSYWNDALDYLELMQVKSVVRRTALYLLSLAPPNETSCEITLPYEKSIVANRLGMSPETFSRALGALQDIGIQVEKSKIHIADRDALANYTLNGPVK